MGISENGGGGGGGSGVGSGTGENGGVWGEFIVELDGSVVSIIACVLVCIVSFFNFSVPVLISVNIFSFSEASTSNLFFSKTKK